LESQRESEGIGEVGRVGGCQIVEIGHAPKRSCLGRTDQEQTECARRNDRVPLDECDKVSSVD
jgi:hypothetical protein